MKKIFFVLVLFLALIYTSQAQQKFEIENNALVLPSSIVFVTGSDQIKPESEAALKHVVEYLKAKTYITLMRVEGHVAAGSNEDSNYELTKKRAVSVCKWLINNGVECSRLLPVGFGSSKPIDTNSTPEGRSKNNRCMFVNASLRGKAIGGMPVDGGGMVAGDPCK